MRLILVGRVLEVFEGEKSKYVTMNDTELGGQVKLNFPLSADVKLDSLVNLDAMVKPGIGKFGQMLVIERLNKPKEGGN